MPIPAAAPSERPPTDDWLDDPVAAEPGIDDKVVAELGLDGATSSDRQMIWIIGAWSVISVTITASGNWKLNSRASLAVAEHARAWPAGHETPGE